MGLKTCIECGREVYLSYVGHTPAAVMTFEPLDVLCRPCVQRLELDVVQDYASDQGRVQHRGLWFKGFGPAFLHSHSPKAAHVFAQWD